MRKLHMLLVAIFWIALFGFMTYSWAGMESKKTITDSKSDVTKTMEVFSEEGKLSDITFIRGDTAFVMIYYSISGIDSKKVWQDLQIIQKISKVKKIKVYLDCWGGDAYSGFAIADNFLRMKGKYEISVHASGVVASAAVIVFASFDNRYASPNCFFMVHEAAIPSAQGMDKSDVKIMDKLMDKLEERYLNILITNSNLSKDAWQDKIERTTWFSAYEAKEWGLVTEVK